MFQNNFIFCKFTRENTVHSPNLSPKTDRFLQIVTKLLN